jgi:hypothetical protein
VADLGYTLLGLSDDDHFDRNVVARHFFEAELTRLGPEILRCTPDDYSETRKSDDRVLWGLGEFGPPRGSW